MSLNAVNKKIEILAPAGSMDQLNAAVDAGANAVYVGLKGFSSRPDAWSMNLDEIKQASSIVHKADMKIYVAMNAEYDSVYYKKIEAAAGIMHDCMVDSLIVGDYGLLHYLKQIGNKIPVHASTLLGVYNSECIKFLRENYDINRIIMNTNLFFEEIVEIHRLCPDTELEIICNGGVCFNDNRRCRLPHDVTDNKFTVGCRENYMLLDTKNDCYIGAKSIIDPVNEYNSVSKNKKMLWAGELDISNFMELFIKAGVTSFKIEGRTRTHEYVRDTVKKYKTAVKNLINNSTCQDFERNPFFYFIH